MGKLVQLKWPQRPTRNKLASEVRAEDLGQLLLFTGIRYSRRPSDDGGRLPPTQGNGALKKATRE
ncbi:MAG: hypothetical protein KDJ19_08750 [Hyphomicrobiaceae bacterium]|nr:hypothetical protein [Hyphomicrobiaceae bacterium]MCC0023163.1 hypothetical protein [Hyphomicrobiaceae bacterium]